MSCDDVNKILADSGYYTGGPFSAGNWMTQVPFLFWDPIFHWGDSERRSRSRFHFRRKHTLCDRVAISTWAILALYKQQFPISV